VNACFYLLWYTHQTPASYLFSYLYIKPCSMSFLTSDVDTWLEPGDVVHPVLYLHDLASLSGPGTLGDFISALQLVPDIGQTKELYIIQPASFVLPGTSPSTALCLELAPDSNPNTSSLLFTGIRYLLARTPTNQWYTLVVGLVLRLTEWECWLEEFAAYGCLAV
jgi:hypothetical protein